MVELNVKNRWVDVDLLVESGYSVAEEIFSSERYKHEGIEKNTCNTRCTQWGRARVMGGVRQLKVDKDGKLPQPKKHPSFCYC